MLTLRKIENVPTGPNNRPKLAVKVVGASSNLSAGIVYRIDALSDIVECGEM